MVCTASVELIDRLISNGEVKASDLEGEKTEQISEAEIIEQRLDAYEDVVLDPTRESTSFAAEGTVMHDVRASCLSLDLEPHNFVGQDFKSDGFSFVIDDDMADHLVEGIDWIRERAETVAIERRVSLDEWLPGNYGFCDTYWLMPVKGRKGVSDLYVSDFKFGIGEPVAAVDNRQLRLYAMGAWVELGKPNVRNVVLVIDQPRAGGIKTWEISFDELMAFAEEVSRAYERIISRKVEFAPNTSSCRWCPVRKAERGCAAFNQWMLSMIGNSVGDLSADDPKFVEPSQMARAMRYYIVRNAAAIRAWLAKLHEESLQAAIAGDPDPGSKAIEPSGGRRFFTDEAKAQAIIVNALGDDAFKPKALISFTEIDTKMKPGRTKQGHPKHYADLLKLVDKSEAKPKLVPADHPAPAYSRSAEDDFEDQITDTTEDDFEEI